MIEEFPPNLDAAEAADADLPPCTAVLLLEVPA